ncbi:MAG: DUF664 domain-containing protein [Streptosporangiales bacterium]|nr:DUF664 domain-containing protein [Streptosporangiales bacterium]
MLMTEGTDGRRLEKPTSRVTTHPNPLLDRHVRWQRRRGGACGPTSRRRRPRAAPPPPASGTGGCGRMRRPRASSSRQPSSAVPSAAGHLVRSVLHHMIAEYARHCGHGDIIRETILPNRLPS